MGFISFQLSSGLWERMFSLNSCVFIDIHQEMLMLSIIDLFLKHLELRCGN